MQLVKRYLMYLFTNSFVIIYDGLHLVKFTTEEWAR